MAAIRPKRYPPLAFKVFRLPRELLSLEKKAVKTYLKMVGLSLYET